MSRYATSFVLGYHGCDEEVGRRAVTEGLALEQSKRDYDWLGPGVYFWESDPIRAMEWAREKAARGDIKSPFVVGAVIDLQNCLDLLVRENIQWLTIAYEAFSELQEKGGLSIPENKDHRGVNQGDKTLRFRDCAVIKHLHTMIESEGFALPGEEPITPFDTVRGLFVEGDAAYPGGGFYRKTHTQIAVRNDACIKGLFLPRHVNWTDPD